jgi:hypothetical protein
LVDVQDRFVGEYLQDFCWCTVITLWIAEVEAQDDRMLSNTPHGQCGFGLLFGKPSITNLESCTRMRDI